MAMFGLTVTLHNGQRVRKKRDKEGEDDFGKQNAVSSKMAHTKLCLSHLSTPRPLLYNV